MSEYSSTRARLTLRSLDELKERLGMREISCDVRYLASDERISSLGKVISRNMEGFAATNPAACSKKNVMENLTKAASLKDALEEKEFVFLREAAGRMISARDLGTIDEAKGLMKTGDVAHLSAMEGDIASVLANLSSAVRQAHSVLTATEKKVVSEMALRSLAEMGYEARIKERGNELLIRGIREDLSIAMRVTEKNELNMDMAGFTGGSCTGELDRLNETLRKHGIDCETIERVHHGKKEGGVLAQEVIREVPFSFNPLETKVVKNNQRGKFLKLNALKQKIKRR